MYPQEYLDYLLYFHAERDYFECHEVLEGYWKKKVDSQKREKVWVGLIQLAVALYHQRRNNFPGALKMMNSALNILKLEVQELEQLGMNAHLLLDQLIKSRESIQAESKYESISLPLKTDLLEKCQQICQERGLNWETPSDLNNENLIHKHTLRDRSEIRAEREQQKERRKNN